MAQPSHNQQSAMRAFDKLQSMVNMVLVQTGRTFVDPSKRTAQSTERTKEVLKRAVPGALNRYHEALDELEAELLKAKAVMRRDLAVCQAERLKREQAEAAERQHQTAEATASTNLSPAKPSPGVAVTAETKGTRDEDAMVIDNPRELDNTTSTKEVTNGTDMSRHPSTQKTTSGSTAMVKQASTQSNKSSKATTSTSNLLPGDGQQNQNAAAENKTPDTAGIDLDFDSMFNDLPSGNEDTNDMPADTDNMDFDFSVAQPNDQTTAYQQDDNVSSLLRGLEDYANINPNGNQGSGNNINTSTFGLNLPNAPNSAANPQQQSQGQGGSNQQQQQLHQQETGFHDDSAFDDLFNSYEDFDMEGTGDGATGDQDTQFDDAFFQIEGA